MRGASFRLRHASVHYRGLPALDRVDLRVDAGERVAVVGPSGSGKTTLLRLLNGILRPTAGRVEANGEGLATLGKRGLRALRASIGFVHQDHCLVPNLRVSQNVLSGRLGCLSFFGSLRTMLFPGREQLARVHEILEEVGIPEKLFERTDRLSGGQQQRVAIARAVIQDPVALLADEPVASVDPARARDTVALLTEISGLHGLTLVMSLHNLDLAREFFPRLVGLRRGRKVFDKPTALITEEEFEELYRLEREEMLADGA